MTFAPASKRRVEGAKGKEPDAASTESGGGSPRYVQALMGGARAEPEVGARAAIQRSPDGGALAAPPDPAVHAATNDRSGGQPLATAVGGDAAPRATAGGAAAGALADVHVHTDTNANVLARGLGAHAFTRGSHIYFAHGRFQPETAEGQRLISHELVHVEQNARGGPAREGVSEATDTSEREADAASRSSRMDAGHAVATSGPSATLSRDQDGDLSTRVQAFKLLVLRTAQHRLLDNRENLAQWRTYLEDTIPLDEFKRELVGTESVQAIKTLGPYSETYFTTENPSMQQYLGTVASGEACPSCHGFMRAQQDKRRTTTVAERLIEYGGDETGLPPLHRRAFTTSLPETAQHFDAVAAYMRSLGGGSGSTAQPGPAFSYPDLSFLEDRAPLTNDQRDALMKRMYKTIAKLNPILGVLGPDGFKVLPSLIGIGERIDQTPEQIMSVRQSVIDSIETRRQQYLDLYNQIEAGDIEWMHFGPIIQDLVPIADADVQTQIKDELDTWERNQRIKAIFTLGVTLMLLLLAIFPPTSPLGIAALAAFEVGWGAHLIQEGQDSWRLGSAFSNATGATNVLTAEQAQAGGGMMFMGAFEIVGGLLTGAGGFARAASIPNMPLASFAPRMAPTLLAGTRTMQFGEFTVTVEANGTVVLTHAAHPDLLMIVRNGEGQLYQSMGPGGMRLIDTRAFPIPQVGPDALAASQGGALVPFQQPGLTPFQQPGALVPFQQPGALVPYQPPGPLVPYQQPIPFAPYGQCRAPWAPSTALVPYQPPGALVPYQPQGAMLPYQPQAPAAPFVPQYALPLGADGDSGVMLMTRGLRPADFGLAPIADDPVLLRLWNASLRDVATGSNAYSRYLAALENGTPVNSTMLERAFGSVNGNFLDRARAAGYDIATVHHWNWPKSQYPEQVVDPRNLVPIPEQALTYGTSTHPLHYGIHRLTSSGTNVYVDPTGAIHVIPIDGWTNPWLPPQ